MRRYSLGVLLAIFSMNGFAGVEISGSRLIYNEGAQQATMSLSNPDNKPYLIQAWVDKKLDESGKDKTFIVTPPLFRLEPRAGDSVRVKYIGDHLPRDRESMYWLNIKSIPSISKDESNKLVISVKSVFKLFYRPVGLAGKPEVAYQKITFSLVNGKLLANNPTPYFISLYELNFENKSIDKNITLKPFSNEEIIETSSQSGLVTWRAVNDFGVPTSTAKFNL